MKSFSQNIAASFLVVSMFYAAAACSSGNSTGSVAGDKTSFINQVCDAFMPCCTKSGKSSDPAKCRTVYNGLVGSAPYDAAMGSKCLDELRAQSGSATFCADTDAPSCEKVFSTNTGTAKPGEPCEDESDCAPSAEGDVACASIFKDGMTIQKCQVRVPGKLGDACVATRDGNSVSTTFDSSETDVPPRGAVCDVKDNLHCDSTSKTCKTIPKIGEACTGFGSYACSNDAYCNMGTCAARKAAGEPCDGFSSSQCAETAFCDTMAKTCKALIADGGACTSFSQCVSGRCTEGKCEADSGSTDFLCAD